jgi:flap endonuclease-1
MLKRASSQSLLGLASKRPSAKGDLQSESVPVGSTSSTTTAAEPIKPTSAKIEQLLKPVAATETTKPSSVPEESTPSTVAVPKPIESTDIGQSPTPIESASTAEPVSPLEVLAHALTKLELAPSQTTPPSAPTEPANPELEKNMAASDLTFGLTQLFARFQRSVPEVEASAAEASSTPAADADDAQTLRTISKQQRALTAGEARVWRALPSAQDCGALAADVAGLLGQSVLIAESYGRRANVATAQTYAEAREVLGALGVPCILPAGACEAEALAAALVVHGHADYVVSEDTVRASVWLYAHDADPGCIQDVLVYEAPLVRNMTNRLGPLQVISGAEVRGALGLDRAGFVDFALLLGTDFSQRIKNVGPARALKLIRTHGSIEGIVRAEGRYPPRVPVDAYLAQVAVARAVFGTLPPVPDVEELASQPADDARARDVLRKYGVRDADFTSWEADEGAGTMGDAYFGDHPSSIREQDFDSFVPYQ